MKITIDLDAKKVFVISVLLIFLLVTSVTYGQRRSVQTEKQESPSIASQFSGSFVCLISQCGWPAIVFLILPAVAVFIWKKFFSLG